MNSTTKHTIKKGKLEASIKVDLQSEHVTISAGATVASFYFNEDIGDLMICVTEFPDDGTHNIKLHEIAFSKISVFSGGSSEDALAWLRSTRQGGE